MHTIIPFQVFSEKAKQKYTADEIESVIDLLAENPHAGKKLQACNNIFQLDMQGDAKGKHVYQLYYYYENTKKPLYLINIYRKGEKDILSKIISVLVR